MHSSDEIRVVCMLVSSDELTSVVDVTLVLSLYTLDVQVGRLDILSRFGAVGRLAALIRSFMIISGLSLCTFASCAAPFLLGSFLFAVVGLYNICLE